MPIESQFYTHSHKKTVFKHRLNTENGGFTGVKPTFELKHDQEGFVKEIPRDTIYLFS